MKTGGKLGQTASVASFFISRVDTAVDAALEKIGRSDLKGTTAIDNARLAYARFREIFAGDRWDRLAAAGARVQRPLWASTGTKNPAYADTLYVDSLIGPDTVNTLPPATLKAFIDHGRASLTIDKDVAGARSRITALADIGISLETITGAAPGAGCCRLCQTLREPDEKPRREKRPVVRIRQRVKPPEINERKRHEKTCRYWRGRTGGDG